MEPCAAEVGFECALVFDLLDEKSSWGFKETFFVCKGLIEFLRIDGKMGSTKKY